VHVTWSQLKYPALQALQVSLSLSLNCTSIIHVQHDRNEMNYNTMSPRWPTLNALQVSINCMLDRVHNSRRPLERLQYVSFALCDPDL